MKVSIVVVAVLSVAGLLSGCSNDATPEPFVSLNMPGGSPTPAPKQVNSPIPSWTPTLHADGPLPTPTFPPVETHTLPPIMVDAKTSKIMSQTDQLVVFLDANGAKLNVANTTVGNPNQGKTVDGVTYPPSVWSAGVGETKIGITRTDGSTQNVTLTVSPGMVAVPADTAHTSPVVAGADATAVKMFTGDTVVFLGSAEAKAQANPAGIVVLTDGAGEYYKVLAYPTGFGLRSGATQVSLSSNTKVRNIALTVVDR